MYPVPNKPRQNENCEIDIKKSKSGTKIRFRGSCNRSQLEMARAEANRMPEGEKKLNNLEAE